MDFLNQDQVFLASKIAGAVAIVAVTVKVCLRLKTMKRNDFPRDTVILYHPGRGPDVPSLVPFAVKLETYLRVTKIPYMSEATFSASKKGKFPWIEYNGVQISDTEFIIEYLNKKLGINLDEPFSPKDLGLARAFQKMFEENTYWTLVIDRWFYEPTQALFKIIKFPFPLSFFFRRKIRNMLYAQGTGRHTQEEVYHILDTDLNALSIFLGKKKFLLGDKPCKADCSIFGMLSQAYWQSFGSKAGEIIRKYNNLCDYCERMKSSFWPDWEQCVTRQKVN